jgi:hypothetical protein
MVTEWIIHEAWLKYGNENRHCISKKGGRKMEKAVVQRAKDGRINETKIKRVNEDTTWRILIVCTVMMEYWKRSSEVIYKHHLNRFTTVFEALKYISFFEYMLHVFYLIHECLSLRGVKVKCKIYIRFFECDNVSESSTNKLTTLWYKVVLSSFYLSSDNPPQALDQWTGEDLIS